MEKCARIDNEYPSLRKTVDFEGKTWVFQGLGKVEPGEKGEPIFK